MQRIRAAFSEQITTETNLRRVEKRFGRPTDLSRALSSASDMLKTAPFRSTRSVINIIGNGPDNVGADAQGARNATLALGFTINGVVLGQDPDVIEYFQQKVVGGPGSFVEHVPSSELMAKSSLESSSTTSSSGSPMAPNRNPTTEKGTFASLPLLQDRVVGMRATRCNPCPGN